MKFGYFGGSPTEPRIIISRYRVTREIMQEIKKRLFKKVHTFY